MTKEQREPYLVLVNIVHRGLCNCCKFASWEGHSCEDTYLICEHPLPVINGEDDDGEHMNDTWQGGDCWAFRPKESPSEVAVWVGILMEGNIPEWRDGEFVAVIPNKNDRYLLGMRNNNKQVT